LIDLLIGLSTDQIWKNL